MSWFNRVIQQELINKLDNDVKTKPMSLSNEQISIKMAYSSNVHDQISLMLNKAKYILRLNSINPAEKYIQTITLQHSHNDRLP